MTTPANRPDLHSTLRELHRIFRARRLWGVIGAAVLITALAGPFYTLESLEFSSRLLYWGFVGVGSGALNTALIVTAHHLNQGRMPAWLADAIASSLGIIPVMGMVYAANLVTDIGIPPSGFWGLFPYVAVPVVVISVLVGLLMPSRAPSPDDTDVPDSPTPLIFEKLPKPLGRDLISMQAQDHYVEVTTTQGKAMVLMRLSDAEQGLTAYDGQRVHRSWWVNMAHVTGSEKGANGALDVVLSNGTRVPVSRNQRPAIRALLADR